MNPTPRIPDRQRRLLLATPLLLLPAALAAQQRRPTPRMTLGPFYPDVLPADRDADLTAIDGQPGRAAGTLLYVTGRVTDMRGKPLPKARLELWQANDKGRYLTAPTRTRPGRSTRTSRATVRCSPTPKAATASRPSSPRLTPGARRTCTLLPPPAASGW